MSLMRRHQQNHGTVLGQMPHTKADGSREACRADSAGGAAGEFTSPAMRCAAGAGLLSGQQLAAFLTASLAEDVKQLKDISSKERKALVKRETLIPQYRPYVQRLLADNAQHEAVGWLLVWLMDGEIVEEGQTLARHCVETGQKLPENFKAEPGYFYADTLLAWAENEFNAGRSFEPYVSALLEDADNAPDAWNLPDSILARIHRLRGLAAEKAADLETARAELTRALELGAQVKTALSGVEKKLEKATPSA